MRRQADLLELKGLVRTVDDLFAYDVHVEAMLESFARRDEHWLRGCGVWRLARSIWVSDLSFRSDVEHEAARAGA